MIGMRTTAKNRLWEKHAKDIGGWLIMAPGIVLFCFFVWIPLLQAVNLSLYEANGMRLVEFVGLKQYAAVISQVDFLPALRNTVSYTLWSLLIGFCIPMLLAVIIHEMTRGKSLLRVSIYLPNMVPGLAMAFLWRFLYKSGDNGGLNMLFNALGIPSTTWLANADLVIPLIVVALTWKGAGATTLLYLAGLQSINPELYEAAVIDGANVRQRIRHITVPQLYNLARTLLVLQIISVFQILYEPLVMTNGGPNNASTSLMQLVFRYAFEQFNYPRASAVSVLISLALIVLTLTYNKLNKPKDM